MCTPNIVICCDGTDNEVATDSTNVLWLYRMLERDDRQVAYYVAGVHSDVGGGYPEPEATLAKVPLVWMLREAEALGLHINQLERTYLLDSKKRPAPDPCGPIHESLTGIWGALEWLPRRTWNGDTERMRWHGPHRGRQRFIQSGAVVHASVVERIAKIGYSPRNLPSDYQVES